MNIIDVETKGNVVRFYLGENGSQWGDDWNDAPYEHNAGRVYDKYIQKVKDVPYPFDSLVLQPSDGVLNSEFTKEDMINRIIPCLIIVPLNVLASDKNGWRDDFSYWNTNKRSTKIYFGDSID